MSTRTTRLLVFEREHQQFKFHALFAKPLTGTWIQDVHLNKIGLRPAWALGMEMPPPGRRVFCASGKITSCRKFNFPKTSVKGF